MGEQGEEGTSVIDRIHNIEKQLAPLERPRTIPQQGLGNYGFPLHYEKGEIPPLVERMMYAQALGVQNFQANVEVDEKSLAVLRDMGKTANEAEQEALLLSFVQYFDNPLIQEWFYKKHPEIIQKMIKALHADDEARQWIWKALILPDNKDFILVRFLLAQHPLLLQRLMQPMGPVALPAGGQGQVTANEQYIKGLIPWYQLHEKMLAANLQDNLWGKVSGAGSAAEVMRAEVIPAKTHIGDATINYAALYGLPGQTGGMPFGGDWSRLGFAQPAALNAASQGAAVGRLERPGTQTYPPQRIQGINRFFELYWPNLPGANNAAALPAGAIPPNLQALRARRLDY